VDKKMVELVTIDKLVLNKKISPPDVVKIDVEGAEMDVLKGMVKTILQFQPIIIYELDDQKDESFQKRFDALDKFLISRNYIISQLENSYPTGSWIVGHHVAIPNMRKKKQ
jgi:hypothetical protein